MSYVAVNKVDESVALGESVEVLLPQPPQTLPAAAGAVPAGACEPPSAMPTRMPLGQQFATHTRRRQQQQEQQYTEITQRQQQQQQQEAPHYSSSTTAMPRTLLRQTSSTSAYCGIFLSGMRWAMSPDAGSKAVAMWDLKDPNPAAHTVIVRSPSTSIMAMASSPCCSTLAVSNTTGWIAIFGIERLLAAAEPTKVAPCAELHAGSSAGRGVIALAFGGRDGGWLMSLCDNGVEVRDTQCAQLSLVATLPFRASQGAYGGSALSCVGTLVAAAGGSGANNPRSGDADSCRVRVWNLPFDAGDSIDAALPLLTLDLTTDAHSVALRPCGTELAVGTGNGSILIYEELVNNGVERGRLEEPGNRSAVNSLQYHPDETLLAAGRANGSYTVYDVSTAATVARFEQGAQSCGLFCAWSPTCDVIAVGGFQAPVTFRTIRAPVSQTISIHGRDSDAPPPALDGAAMSASGVIALVSGSRLVVKDGSDAMLVDVDVGAQITSYHWGSPVSIRSDGHQVACLLNNGLTVSVRNVPGGEPAFEVGPWKTSCLESRWSPDGQYFVTCVSSAGAFVYNAVTGTEVCHLQDNKKHILCCAFDATSSWLATAGADKCVRIRSTADWVVTQTLTKAACHIHSVCFDPTASHVGYYIASGGAGSVVVRALDCDGSTHSNNRRFEDVNAFGSLSFSPDGRILACGGDSAAPGKHLTLLSLESGEEWCPCLPYMALQEKKVVGTSVCWTVGGGSRASNMLFVAAGSQVAVVDVYDAERAVADNAWNCAQLIKLSENESDRATSLVAAAPHLVNIQDHESGDTVLHHLARTRNVALLEQLLEAHSSVVTPISNSQGQSVLCVAIECQEKRIAKFLWNKLTPSLTYVSSPLVAKELRTLAQTIPELVLPFLLDVEPTIFTTVTTFRASFRDGRCEEVCGLDSAVPPMDKGAKLQELMPSVPSVWARLLPDSGSQGSVLVASKVLLLPHFLGKPERSPFHAIVLECPAVIFQSKLMRLAVQYKWETNVWPKMKLQIAGYACCLALATVAMVLTSRLGSDGLTPSGNSTGPGTSGRGHLVDADFAPPAVTTALVVGMTVAEGVSLCNEAYQLVRMGWRSYVGLWNAIDSSASIVLLVGAGIHFLNDEGFGEGGRSVGAVGVALKWLGFVDSLRCFGSTGSLVRMVLVIIGDMIPFLALLGVVLLGSVSFLMVHQPLSEAFGFDTSTNGPLWPLVTVFLSLVGSFEVDDYHGMSLLMLCIFLFVVSIVLLNLLIAIMGDSYEKVKENENLHALHERAKIIVEMEQQHPSWHTFHEFMHVIEAADEDGKPVPEWEGITGRVKQLLELESRKIKNERSLEIKTVRDELTGKVDELRDELTGKVDELTGKVDEIGDLLRLLVDTN
eukprot:COSAG01_NODE_2584_length_7418_cov_4.468643_5_plen_1380_part_01